MLCSNRLSRLDLLEIEAELESLDRNVIRHDWTLLLEIAAIGSTYIREGPVTHGEWAIRPLACWKYLFSPRLMAVDAFELADQCYQRAVICETLPWSQATAEYDQIVDSFMNSRNPIVSDLVTKRMFYTGQESRKKHAQLRLLRIAVHYLATREVLNLDDPFGDKIQYSVRGSALRVWSIGGVGVNIGGPGDWTRKGKDIVLEIEPR